ncbi:hypothetical protein FDP41_000506 [Naegleria fowleri]|uniref:Uncharacterized protein n=1 Tax=Naegleria fowleri TaxID=5763 RepID=A0A6A5C5P9_NAEFO|nr:uncharacterized protein FDP41_000506 [Naegleria fowleri]KAF0984607.1 hypothetical protein FDP41_000506 [Naegleria fowleri]
MSAIEDPSQQFTSKKDTLIKWTNQHQKLCKQLLSSQTIQENVLLQLIELLEEDPRFDYGGLTIDHNIGVVGLEETQNITKKRLQATQLFLDVWRYLITRVDMINISLRIYCYQLILLIIKRREFHPKYFQNLILSQITNSANTQSFNSSNTSPSELSTSPPTATTTTDLSFLKLSPTFNPNNQPHKKGLLSSILSSMKKGDSNDELSKKVLYEYKELLIRTQDFVVNQVLRTKKHENIVVELFRFCASILAVNCFRLLSAEQTEEFVSSLCLKQFGHDFVEPETVENVNRNLDIKKANFIKKLKYVPSMAGLSTLLDDNEEDETPDETTGADDEEKSYVHKTVFCYFKFLFEIDPLNDASKTKTMLSKVHDWMKDSASWLPTSKVCGDFFHYFFSDFVDQISKIMKHDTSNKHWQMVPGYNTLVTNFTQLGEIYLTQHINLNFSDAIISSSDTSNKQEQKIQRLEESARGEDGHESFAFKQWLSCSLIALRNPRVINILLEIFFSNTNGYSPDQVFYTLDWADKWFEEVRQLEHNFQQYLIYRNQKHQHTYFYLESSDSNSNIELFIGSLPENFNFEFFETAIERLLETDHFQIMSRTLIFIYDILDLFNGKARMKFIGHDLLRDRFYHLFLHWSADIRNIFQRIILFKLQRYSSAVFREYAPLTATASQSASKRKASTPMLQRDRSNSNSLTPPAFEKKKVLIEVEDLSVRRSLEDFEPRRTSISGTRPSIESIISYSSSSKKKLVGSISTLKKKNKEVVQTEESVVTSEFQRVEESIDLVLKSKVDTYLQVLRTVENDPSALSEMIKDNPSLEIPPSLVVYVNTAMEEFEALEKECDAWKREVASLLLANKKASKVKLSQIPYPRINFPRFTLQSDKLLF